MSNILTTSKLIKSIKRRAMLPKDENTFETDDYLDMLNEEIQYFGIPHLLSAHEEYLVTFEDIAIEEDKVRYPIPYRAIGNKLRDVAIVTSSGTHYELSRISLEDLSDYNGNYYNEFTDLFYVENNEIVLVDGPTSTDAVVRMYFYLKPNTLVQEKFTAAISNIDADTGVLTLETFPDEFANLQKMDFVRKKSPNIILSYDITPTAVNVNSKTITFDTDDISSKLAVGDYLCLAEQSPVPQLPTELHPILAQRVAVAALEALGDQQNLQIAMTRLQMMEKASGDLIDNRVEGAPEKIKNRHSPLIETAIGANYYKRKGRY